MRTHQSSVINHQSEKGFSPLIYLLPLALIFVGAVFIIQTNVFQKITKNPPAPTPNLMKTEKPQVDLEECNDPYNPDCYEEDDEADEVKPEDLLGPD